MAAVAITAGAIRLARYVNTIRIARIRASIAHARQVTKERIEAATQVTVCSALRTDLCTVAITDTTTVAAVKIAINGSEMIPVDLQELYINGRLLADTDLIKTAMIQELTTKVMMLV